MTARFTLPFHKEFRYMLNFETGLYEIDNFPLGVLTLPTKFKIEITQRKEIVDSEYIIRGKKEKWENKILTGLRKISDCWFYGDTIKSKKKSYILFNISDNKQEILIFLFGGFYPATPQHRQNLNDYFICEQKERHITSLCSI